MNLITDRPTRAQILALLNPPASPPILPPASSPAWGKIFGRPDMEAVLTGVLARARADVGSPVPALPDSLYRKFNTNGTRDEFQGPYFERRRRLGRAGVGLLAGGAGERAVFRRSFLACLNAVAEERSWALPAHVGNASGQDPFCIDLASAQTAYLLAEATVVFGDLIPRPVRTRLCERIGREFFDHYLGRGGEFFWTSHTSNWNAVCHHGVIGAALAIDEDMDRLASLLEAAGPRLAGFLDGFTDDGGCSEGPDYWAYGFGCFSALNEMMEMRTGGALSLFAGNAKVARIAAYAPAMSLEGGAVVNFSDAKNLPLSGWLLGYLGLRLDDASCRRQAAENARRLCAGAGGAVDYDAFNADFTHWQRLFRHSIVEEESHETRKPKPDAFFPGLGVWVVRGRDEDGVLWELAAKGGHNAEHHNHNDVGSFLLNVDGVPLITEIGSPEYTRDYFREEMRYSFLAARSLGHSLPVINGDEQAAGPQFRGEITRAEHGVDVACFELDLARAYPDASGVKRFTRRLELEKSAGRFSWSDEVRLARAGTVESGLITEADEVVIVSPARAVLRRRGVELELLAGGDGRWLRVERHDYRDHRFNPTHLHRLVLGPGVKTKATVLHVEAVRVKASRSAVGPALSGALAG